MAISEAAMQFGQNTLAATKDHRWLACAAVSVALASLLVGVAQSALAFVAVIALATILLILSALRMTTVLMVLCWVTFFVCGAIGYYLSIEEIYWIPYILAVAAFVLSVVRPARGRPSLSARLPVPKFVAVYFAFYAVFLASFLATVPSVGIAVLAAKIYIPFFLVIFVVYKLNPEHVWRRFEQLVLIAPLIELPFVLHQHFFVFARNGNWDAVVGTFGGDPNGGGASPVLMLFTLVSVLVATRLVLLHRLRLWKGLVVGAAAMAIILLGEVKAFIFLLPFAMAVQEWRLIFRRPLAAIVVGVLAVALAGFVNAYYYDTYLTAAYYANNSIWDTILGADQINYYTGEVGRWASVQLWWLHAEGVERWFGYGAAATRVSSALSMGTVAAEFYPLNMGATTVSRLLWEGGIVATALYFTAILLAIVASFRLGRPGSDPVAGARASIFGAVFALMVPFAFYNNTALDHSAVQLLFAMCFAMLWRQAADRSRPLSGREIQPLIAPGGRKRFNV